MCFVNNYNTLKMKEIKIMRLISNSQVPLFNQWSDHTFSNELRDISEILDDLPEINHWVYNDLTKNLNFDFCGPTALTAEQVLRAAIIKQQNSWTYETLSLQCVDSAMTKSFLRLQEGQKISKSCLHENIVKIAAKTWSAINDHIVQYAADKGYEKGRTIRMDATVVKSNIHPPTDSSLIFDCIRVSVNSLKTIRKKLNKKWYLSVSVKESKQLLLQILSAKNQRERKIFYRLLLKKARDLKSDLKRLKDRLDKVADKAAKQVNNLLKIYDLLPAIIEQTSKRVIKGKYVSSNEKIVSIFEDHTDIIVKGRREAEFGHKTYLTAGKTGLVLDCQIVRGNPSDATLFEEILSKQNEIFGRVPRQTTADGGFASKENLRKAQSMGVKDICFSKRCGLKKEDMTKSIWVFEKLRNFRAGIEGVISVLKRSFGCAKASWKGFDGFRSYVQSSIAAYNLTLLARIRLNPNQ